MMSFRGERLKNYSIPTGSVWLMTDISQSTGRQELYAKQAPQLLKVMREMALVQSAESSNRYAPQKLDTKVKNFWGSLHFGRFFYV